MDRMTAQLPNNLKQWTFVAIGVALMLLVFITGIAAAQHLSDEQFITGDELQDDVQQLKSYTAETVFLYQYTESNAAPRSYVQTYASSLKDNTDAIAQKLTEHAHDQRLDDKVKQTIDEGNTLSSLLNDLSTQPTNQLPADHAKTLEELTKNLQQTEDEL